MTLDLNKLAAAKLWLTGDAPGDRTPGGNAEAPKGLAYMASALYALVPVESAEVRTMTCDERWRIYINPVWFASAEVPQLGSHLAHLLWHLLGDHASRARANGVDGTSAAAWARAADAAVCRGLRNAGLLVEGLPTPTLLRAPWGLSAEEYFLVTEMRRDTQGPDSQGSPGACGGIGADRRDATCGSGADGQTRTYELLVSKHHGAVGAVGAQALRRTVMIHYEEYHRTTRGEDPGNDIRWILDALESRTPWQKVLNSSVRSAIAWATGRGDYTFTRLSRRTGATGGATLPGQHRAVPQVAVVIDTSGSMDDALIGQALAEVDGALHGLGVAGAELAVYSVDAAIQSHAIVRRAKDLTLIGGGGTNLIPGITAATSARPRPDVIIVMTDGDTPWPRTPPCHTQVVGLILGRSARQLPPTPGWVTRIECVID